MLGSKWETLACVNREHIRDWFLYFIEPLLFNLYHSGINRDRKVYPMNGDMGEIALYLTNGVRKSCSNVDLCHPLWTLWNEYVPEEQKAKFQKNILMEISES